MRITLAKRPHPGAEVISLRTNSVDIINGGLILSLRRGGTHRQIEMLRRAAKAARNPWAEQNKAMSELRERVSELEVGENGPDE